MIYWKSKITNYFKKMLEESKKIHQEENPKNLLKKFLFQIARHPWSGKMIGFAFANLTSIMPINLIDKNKNTITFEHPSKFWQKHYLIVPTSNIKNFLELDFDRNKYHEIIFDILRSTQTMIQKKYIKPEDNFSLLVNGGLYQDVPQLHFHLASGIAKTGDGILPTTYQPKIGNPILENNHFLITQNSNPQRKIDLIIAPNIPAIDSISKLNINQSSQTIIHSLKAVQNYLKEKKYTAYTLSINESDIKNTGRLIIRLQSGSKI